MARLKMGNRPSYRAVIGRFLNPFLTGVTAKKRSIFFYDLQRYISAGVSYYDAVTTMRRYCRSRHLARILDTMHAMVHSGRGLGDAMALFPSTFGEFELAMVDLGESTGKLDLTLGNIAQKLKADHMIKQKVQRGLFYPVLVLVAALFISWLLKRMGYLTPFPVTPPFVALLVLVIIGLVLGIKLIRATPGIGYAFDSVTCALPFFGKVRMKAALARFATAFSYAYASGCDIQQTLRLSGRSAMNNIFAADAERIASEVESGVSLSEAFDRSHVMPPLLKQVVAVGEKTGDFDKAMMNVTEFAKEEVETANVMMIHASEVLAVLLLGAFVFLFAATFYKQYFSRGLEIMQRANPHFNK